MYGCRISQKQPRNGPEGQYVFWADWINESRMPRISLRHPLNVSNPNARKHNQITISSSSSSLHLMCFQYSAISSSKYFVIFIVVFLYYHMMLIWCVFVSVLLSSYQISFNEAYLTNNLAVRHSIYNLYSYTISFTAYFTVRLRFVRAKLVL